MPTVCSQSMAAVWPNTNFVLPRTNFVATDDDTVRSPIAFATPNNTTTIDMHVFSFITTALSLATIAAADCFADNDWNVNLIVKGASASYWAAVKQDGSFTDLWNAQCLNMLSRECEPCKDLMVMKVGLPAEMAPCAMTSPKMRRDDDGEVDVWDVDDLEATQLAGVETRQLAAMQEIVLDPARKISSLTCKRVV
ncbi:hypothetical protein LTR05_006610 [Lithohypha guttulata]|uniref:Uncharacterized protein n=1 Tax=Lithohypha guttulata TaxID=1690604 RepID=A0AAN7SW42_9EURO|nr:hypothetical protein LTR05_006610 [Lithohypha guttulata]